MKNNNRTRLILGLIITLLTLVFINSNIIQTIIFLITWSASFYPIKKDDLFFFSLICLIFIPQDILAISHGVFTFNDPDILGLPIWQFLMWGYWLFFSIRFIKQSSDQKIRFITIILLLIFSLCFTVSTEQTFILARSTIIIIIIFFFHHSKLDFAYFFVMIFLGTIVELLGIYTEIWLYPDNIYPLWSINMWGGIGIFLNNFKKPIYQLINSVIP